MTPIEIRKTIENQRNFFNTGATLPISFRLEALKRLKNSIKNHEDDISAALKEDLGKSVVEAYMAEIGLVLDELSYMIRHIKKMAKKRKVHTPLSQFAASSFVKPSPYGTVLIMSPWNYPLLLTIDPLANAIAAGNTAVVKPSAYSARTGEIMAKIVSECFEPEYVAMVTGGRKENQCLIEEKFDYILFTGSKSVGHEVMRKASEHLTPVTLELGGKTPLIVDKTANLRLTARRLVFGKLLNSGQTCIAPDYVYCDSTVKEKLVEEIKKQIVVQFGENPLNSLNYGKIINRKHYDRLCGLIENEKVVFGGQREEDKLRIGPTVMDNIDWDDKVMGEEIFGPIIPILTFNNLEQAIEKVNSMPHPLAFYFFSSDKKAQERVVDKCQFGGGCINDTIVHMTTSHMGFGGVGASGMGSYHGKTGFDTFSHLKSIVDKKTWLDLPMRYQPYNSINEKIIRMFLK